MFTTNMDDILFKVESLPTYAQISKTDKVYTGHAVIANGKFLGHSPAKLQMITNQELMSAVSSSYRVKWKSAYYTNDKAYFHIIGLSEELIYDGKIIFFEVINSYNRRCKPKINWGLCTKGSYIFTNLLVGIDDFQEGATFDFFKSRLELLKEFIPFVPQFSIKNVPDYLVRMFSYIDTNININGLAFLESISILYPEWSKKSFEAARDFSANLTQELL